MPRRNYPRRPKRSTPVGPPPVVTALTTDQLAQQLVARGIKSKTILDSIAARYDRGPQ